MELPHFADNAKCPLPTNISKLILHYKPISNIAIKIPSVYIILSHFHFTSSKDFLKSKQASTVD